MLARGERGRCDLLQAGRHGSESASSQASLEAVCPALAVISRGKDLGGAYPAEATLKRLTQHGETVAGTDEYCSVEVISDGTRFDAEARR